NSRISGPLLDRFDLYIEVAPLEFCDLSSEKKEESSESIRKRVMAAREIQSERFKGTGISCNAMITDGKLDKYCHIDEDVKKTFNKLYTALQLSGRAYSRLLKVARTIADLSGSENIRVQDIKEAAQYRKR
ncbi:MAG: ATP-binding protein, partial [Ruminococcus sp.]|nr:ATP-binding protein [Ruminococcus sp.]